MKGIYIGELLFIMTKACRKSSYWRRRCIHEVKYDKKPYIPNDYLEFLNWKIKEEEKKRD